MLRKGEWVWVPSNIGVPIGARVKVTKSGQRLLVDDEGKEQKLSEEQETSLKIMHPTSVEGVDDMIKLGDMTEAGVLRNLLLRHKQGLIYTYTGSVLVAVNPYQVFPLYSDEQIKLYHGRKLGELPPHIFAIAESCYFNMKRHLRNQCCIISGESGAGKTESTKLILQYLAAVSGVRSEQHIEQQILESNPLLEAFGNSKTIRNDNSSRFGKYLEIFFNKDGVIEGARIEQYLLEKSRVCHQAHEERNYHVFYSMLAGLSAEEKKSLSLKGAKEYAFLSKGDCIKCDGRNDDADYTRIRSAMRILTFSDKQCYEIFKLLAAILHLGNLCFEANTLNNLDTSDVSKSEHFGIAASLLEVEKSSLANSLTHRSFMTAREKVTKPLSSEQAADCRDALVKAIYNNLFLWIVGRVNGVTYKKMANSPKASFLSIGLLDIFGFENFHTNSFEQLCINFANEKLQQFFVGHIFKLEQKEYMKEDIVWNNVSFSDNQHILDLLAGKTCNLLALIDEESSFPKGSDLTMLSKMNQQHQGNKSYIPSKSEHDSDFAIRHFAGVVCYDSRGFLEKNRDAISTDLFKMVETSNNKLLRQIFESELSTNGVKALKNTKVIMTPKSSLRGRASDNRKQMPTLSGQFRQSLDSLMKALSSCQPYFIRCFKPNNDKQSQVFDRELCMRQMRYSGMMDTIRIRKLGYPIRHTFGDFLNRYRVLLKTTVCDPKTATAAACCEAICKSVISETGEWKIGRTKVFLKDAHDAVLERLREDELSRVAVIIQRVMMGYKDRKSFLRKRRAAVVLQTRWRAYQREKVRRKIRQGFDRLTAKIRGRNLYLQYQKQKRAALTLQTQTRGYLARKDRKQKMQAVLLLQAHTRGHLARREFGKMRSEAALARQEKETQEQMARDIQRRLEEVLQSHLDEMEAELEEPVEKRTVVRMRSSVVEEELDKSDPVEDELQLNDQEESEGNVTFIQSRAIVLDELDQSYLSEPEASRNTPEATESEDRLSVSSHAPSTSPTLDEEDEEEDDEFDDGSDELSFQRFSSSYFQDGAGPSHIAQRLKKPLLKHDDEGDTLACLTVWWIILRFMGDLPEPKALDTLSLSSSTASPQLPGRQGRRLSHLVGLDQKILRRKAKKYGDRRASTIPEEPEDASEYSDILIGEGPTLHRPLTPLEKLHIIVGYALSRRGIRDEIYCQICKQLVNNRNRQSCTQGWILLSICLGIFPPSDLLMKYLQNFVRKGPGGYGAYCSERLERIIANGERKELPCWIELQAVKAKEPIDVSVSLLNGSEVRLRVDSASTSAEVCQAVAEKIQLRDMYGFSLYISLHEKMWSLGSCGKHVLDAVSQCEQELKRQGREEREAAWKLSLRKELFTPWHDCSKDGVSTDLIYRQVIKGMKSGEYTTEKEDEYVQLAQQHYYIQFGPESNRANARKVVEDCIATTLIENKSMSRWIQLIMTALSQDPDSRRKTKEKVKEEFVDSARRKWPLFFSKFYEVTLISGPSLPKNRFVAAVNWSGIFFMDGRDKKLFEIPYVELKDIQNPSSFGPQSVCLSTVRGEFVLRCAESLDMGALMERNLSGLRERSVYAVAQHEVRETDDPKFLACRRGDLLLLHQSDKERSPDDSLVRATNQKSELSGVVNKNVLQILPTLTMPPDEMLELLTPGQRKSSITQITPLIPHRDETVAPISLKEFALENFRSLGKDYGRQGGRGHGREKLWACSKELLKQPLMRSLAGNSDLSYHACNAFTAILKYMGDYPIKQVRSPMELTNQIFGPATQHEALQDEIYCQIMRQMTGNTNRLSVERGWQLMWLCSGLFPPSAELLRHTKRFLESRPRDPLAALCLQRVQSMCSKEPRKLPPHPVEVDAIQQNSTQIFYKVHFPNDTDDILEVASTTTIDELCHSIAAQLNLSSADGYGLYLKTPNKVQSLDEEKYFFDSLRQPSDVPKKGKRQREAGNSVNLPSIVIFKRKLWFNVSPGKDLVADLIFHFPQELPKYLRGYHACSKEDVIKLAGLLFRAQVDSDRTQFIMIPRMLQELVPADQLKLMSSDEWKKHIISSYNKQSGITVQEAKIAFLQAISAWPTFGCAFFEVKQTCESDYPSRILIAISKQGVSLINPQTKELLVMHPFSRITEYSSRGNHFQMTIGTLVRGVIFVCETTQGAAMEDLVRSYVSMYERERNVFQSSNHMFS